VRMQYAANIAWSWRIRRNERDVEHKDQASGGRRNPSDDVGEEEACGAPLTLTIPDRSFLPNAKEEGQGDCTSLRYAAS
jgi:hypothetical protein